MYNTRSGMFRCNTGLEFLERTIDVVSLDGKVAGEARWIEQRDWCVCVCVFFFFFFFFFFFVFQ